MGKARATLRTDGRVEVKEGRKEYIMSAEHAARAGFDVVGSKYKPRKTGGSPDWQDGMRYPKGYSGGKS